MHSFLIGNASLSALAACLLAAWRLPGRGLLSSPSRSFLFCLCHIAPFYLFNILKLILALIIFSVNPFYDIMLPMDANIVRQKFLDFQVSKGHKIISPAPLVLEGDPTTLFTREGAPGGNSALRLSAFATPAGH